MTPAVPSSRLQPLAKELSQRVAKGREVAIDPAHTAHAVGLHYVSDTAPGIRRRKDGKKFAYLDARGRAITDSATLRRIRSLVLPPAWTDVWICADPLGHLQATGIDRRKRKQYKYHPLWREARDMEKYHRKVPFAEALPRIRRRVERDLRLRGLRREKVLAAVVRLLEESLIRVGNEEYARENHSFGLTTLRERQVAVRGDTIRFHFRGKGGKVHDLAVRDEEVARVVTKEHQLPGDEVFQYVDEAGKRHDVTSGEVNGYLQSITGRQFTAKDFRTWAATVHAALLLSDCPCSSTTQAKRNIVRAIEQVAKKLGNTPAVCRKSYVHPLILQTYLRNDLSPRLSPARRKTARRIDGLSVGEAGVLGFLKSRLGK